MPGDGKLQADFAGWGDALVSVGAAAAGDRILVGDALAEGGGVEVALTIITRRGVGWGLADSATAGLAATGRALSSGS